MHVRSIVVRPVPALFVAIVAVACARADNNSVDSTAMAIPAVPADSGMGMKSDTGMAGMAGMNESPVRDADQEFLRMMVDHHQGMVVMADSAIAKGGAHIKADAREMASKQAAEQKKMLGMLKSDYSDDKMPMVMPSNATMLQRLAGKTGAELDRQFRENVIVHHEEGLGMIEKYMTRLTRAEVRQMAEKMKADQTREIAELRSELKGT